MMAMTPEHPEDATLGDIIFRLRDDLDKALARISELEERVRATHAELAMHKFTIVALQVMRVGYICPESEVFFPNRKAFLEHECSPREWEGCV